MNSLRDKIQKSSQIMASITKLLCILLIVGLCIPVVVLIWIACAPNTDFSALYGLSFYSSAGQLLNSTGELIAEMLTIFVSGMLLLGILFLTHRMFKSISQFIDPFSPENAKRLREIAFIIFIYSIAQPFLKTSFYTYFAPKVTMQSSFNVVFIILALMFYFFSMVFDYGAELQRLSDETL